MKTKIYRHSFKKDDKIFYGDWHLSLTIPKEEEEKYTELSKTYHYVKSLGIEESELEVNGDDISNLHDDYKYILVKNETEQIMSNSIYGLKMAELFSKDMMSLAESFPEPKDGVDIYEAINDIIGE